MLHARLTILLIFIFVEPACGKARHSCYNFCSVYVRASVPSIRIRPDHNLYNNAWISKQFGTVVALEEEKCHLKHFLSRLKAKVTGIK